MDVLAGVSINSENNAVQNMHVYQDSGIYVVGQMNLKAANFFIYQRRQSTDKIISHDPSSFVQKKVQRFFPNNLECKISRGPT